MEENNNRPGRELVSTVGEIVSIRSFVRAGEAELRGRRPSCAAVARWCPVGCHGGVSVLVSHPPHNLLTTRNVVV